MKEGKKYYYNKIHTHKSKNKRKRKKKTDVKEFVFHGNLLRFYCLLSVFFFLILFFIQFCYYMPVLKYIYTYTCVHNRMYINTVKENCHLFCLLLLIFFFCFVLYCVLFLSILSEKVYARFVYMLAGVFTANTR